MLKSVLKEGNWVDLRGHICCYKNRNLKNLSILKVRVTTRKQLKTDRQTKVEKKKMFSFTITSVMTNKLKKY